MITAVINNLTESTTSAATDMVISTDAAYTMVDGLLGVWTLFHVFIALGYMAVPDASYKKALLKLHRKIHKPLTDSPFLIPMANIVSTILVTFLCYQTYQNRFEDSIKVARAVVGLHCWATAFFLQRMCNTLVKLGVDYCMKVEKDIEIHNIKAWTKPPKWTGTFATAPLDWFMRPELHGGDNIPTDTPSLYVMNHALYGMEMAPFVATLYNLKDVFVRGLADHFHFGQFHGEILRYFGAVDGTRDNVDALMETKQNVLVYPGGGEEIMKPCAVPKYTLMWKERLGFARCAIKHGYPIVPTCSVGTEDMFTRLFDIRVDFMKKGMKAPVSLINPLHLQKVYFWVGEPIPTAQYNGDYKNDEFAREVRDKVKAAVEAGIREMKERQANDPNRYFINSVGNSVLSFFGRRPSQELLETTTSELAEKVLKTIDSDDSWEPLTAGSEVSDDDDSSTEETKKNL